jgi:hypothetical protein
LFKDEITIMKKIGKNIRICLNQQLKTLPQFKNIKKRSTE